MVLHCEEEGAEHTALGIHAQTDSEHYREKVAPV